MAQLASRKQDLLSTGLLHPHLLNLSAPRPQLRISAKFAPSSDNLMPPPHLKLPEQGRHYPQLTSPETGLTRPSLKSPAGQHIPCQGSQAEICGFCNIKTLQSYLLRDNGHTNEDSICKAISFFILHKPTQRSLSTPILQKGGGGTPVKNASRPRSECCLEQGK